MSGVDAAFWLLASIAIVSGWRVFCTDSMVRASFLLLLSFIAVGLIMLLLAAPYIGVATIFMMAVEMMVMALFMVMFMMNPAGLNHLPLAQPAPVCATNVLMDREAVVADVRSWLVECVQYPAMGHLPDVVALP